MAGRNRKYSFGLDDAKMAVRRRLFLTGTPRVRWRGLKRRRCSCSLSLSCTRHARTWQIFADRGSAAAGKQAAAAPPSSPEAEASTVRSMTDKSLFGPIVSQLSYRDAVDQVLECRHDNVYREATFA